MIFLIHLLLPGSSFFRNFGRSYIFGEDLLFNGCNYLLHMCFCSTYQIHADSIDINNTLEGVIEHKKWLYVYMEIKCSYQACHHHP